MNDAQMKSKILSAPYYLKHLAVACLISCAALVAEYLEIIKTSGFAMLYGPIFYVARETIQRIAKGCWDWPGLFWPVLPLIVLDQVLRWL